MFTGKKDKDAAVLVLCRGARPVAVVRFKPSVPGGDPYDRLLVHVDAKAAETATGLVAFEPEEKPSRPLTKFLSAHESKSWDPKIVTLILSLDGRRFIVRMAEDPALGTVYHVVAKP